MSSAAANEDATAVKNLVEAYKAGAIGAEELGTALIAGKITSQQYAQAVSGLSTNMNLAKVASNTLSTSITSFNTAFAAAADLYYKNIDQLVAVYQATISAISAQNTYTQALALQATAVAIYGSNSEEATRATTAANYVDALYIQAKKNEVVAQEQYATATVTNLGTIASSVLSIIGVIIDFTVAITAFRIAAISSLAQIDAASAATTGEEVLGAVAFAGIFQSGGFVPRTGLALVHQGETVIPAGGAASVPNGLMSSGNVTININASSNVDLPRVRQEVQAALTNTMLHASKQRGVYG